MLEKILTTNSTPFFRRLAVALPLAALAGGFAGCKDASQPAPETGVGYYPVAVGNFWVFAVADTTYSQASGQGAQVVPSVVTASAYQFRETVTQVFTDAAGQMAYRLVRARRASAAAVWRDDSVFVLSATPQFVALNRNNTRTLELVFPVREGRSWNFNAFNNNFNDTITAETRRYSRVGQPFAANGGAGTPAVTYPVTVTTSNTGAALENTLLKLRTFDQVFAKGVGPVFRRRRYLLHYNYTDQATGDQKFPPNSFSGASLIRREILLDYGPR